MTREIALFDLLAFSGKSVVLIQYTYIKHILNARKTALIKRSECMWQDEARKPEAVALSAIVILLIAFIKYYKKKTFHHNTKMTKCNGH